MRATEAQEKSELLNRALSLSRECEALYLIVGGFLPHIGEDFARTRGELVYGTPSELRQFIRDVKSEMLGLRTRYGISVPNSELLPLLEASEQRPAGQFLLVPKYVIERIATRYGKVNPDFSAFPPHARFVLPRQVNGPVEVYRVETTLYEDMCALFNLAHERWTRFEAGEEGKKDFKTIMALSRAAISTALHFVEAYLNGLAFDYFVAHRKSLDSKTMALLTEWDSSKSRPRYVSFRDKLVRYPRIVCGSTSPPLQENNCPELEHVVTRAKAIRDSTVHAAPTAAFDSAHVGKEETLFRWDFADTEKTVDNAVALVRKIESVSHGDDSRLTWLYGRGQDGLFPESSFE